MYHHIRPSDTARVPKSLLFFPLQSLQLIERIEINLHIQISVLICNFFSSTGVSG